MTTANFLFLPKVFSVILWSLTIAVGSFYLCAGFPMKKYLCYLFLLLSVSLQATPLPLIATTGADNLPQSFSQERAEEETYYAPKSQALPVITYQRPKNVLHYDLPMFTRTKTESTGKGPLQIGESRDLPDWLTQNIVWEAVAGGHVAGVFIRSPSAKGTRLGIRFEQLPDAAALYFYTADAQMPEIVMGSEINRLIALNRNANVEPALANLYWSPVINGETVQVEIFLPSPTRTEQVAITFVQLAHLFTSPTQLEQPIQTKDINDSNSCQLDINCYAEWSETKKSVAYMVYQKGSSTFICTGTLLADKDTSTSLPYFLSAYHCIDNQAAASTLETYWGRESNSCDNGQNEGTSVTGGAELLYGSADTDTAFFLLENSPPSGVTFSAWKATPLSNNTEVFGIHHPRGDLKKYTRFSKTEDATCTRSSSTTFSCSSVPSDVGNFFIVDPLDGLTEGGSSGSGIWLKEAGNRYLVGQLYGGNDTTCNETNTISVYGRFDRAYFAAGGLREWLNSPNDYQVKNLNDSGSGSLRTIVEDEAGDGDTITFDANLEGTITLSRQIRLDKNLTIQGPGADKITISGNNASRIFEVVSGSTVAISGLRLINGNPSSGCSNLSSVICGGAILNGGTLIVDNSILEGNRADFGGGIFNRSGSLTMRNTLLSGNSVSQAGGGLGNYQGNYSFINMTISGNQADISGGGVYNLQSNPSFTNSIIWNNRDQTGIGTANSAVFNSSANPSFSYSLVQGLNPGGTGNLTGTTTNPQFAMPLTPGLNTGGDYRLQSTSPARDVGNKDVNMLTTDLDGNQRIIGTQIDLGAYEFRPLGDISGDGVVDQNDSTALISVYGLTPSSPNWNPAADLNGDGRINMLDYRILGKALKGL